MRGCEPSHRSFQVALCSPSGLVCLRDLCVAAAAAALLSLARRLYGSPTRALHRTSHSLCVSRVPAPRLPLHTRHERERFLHAFFNAQRFIQCIRCSFTHHTPNLPSRCHSARISPLATQSLCCSHSLSPISRHCVTRAPSCSD